jgi:hypothetical protein
LWAMALESDNPFEHDLPPYDQSRLDTFKCALCLLSFKEHRPLKPSQQFFLNLFNIRRQP